MRWSDLVRPEQASYDGKIPEVEASAFRNAFICDKKVVDHKIRYCFAFGSQKHMPSRVMKNIAEIEQAVDGKKERYWFSENYIPLYLIKEYEEKVGRNKPVDMLSKQHKRHFKASRKSIFSSLLYKQYIIFRSSCCSCHQDVSYRYFTSHIFLEFSFQAHSPLFPSINNYYFACPFVQECCQVQCMPR